MTTEAHVRVFETVDGREWLTGREFDRIDLTYGVRYIPANGPQSGRLIVNRKHWLPVRGRGAVERFLAALRAHLEGLDGWPGNDEYEAIWQAFLEGFGDSEGARWHGGGL